MPLVLQSDRYLGCLYGIAIGDALGAPVEFTPLESIRSKYGFDGITDMVRRFYTDDTQMSLATANSLIDLHDVRDQIDQYNPTVFAHRRYLKWLKTQTDLSQRRSPGGTCLSALSEGKMGTIDNPINNSKGNGGVMRTAPVGLAFSSGVAFRYGAEFAATTHGHSSGFLSAGFMSEMIFHLSEGADLETAIAHSRDVLATYKHHEETIQKVNEGIELSQSSRPAFMDVETIGKERKEEPAKKPWGSRSIARFGFARTGGPGSSLQ